MAVYTDEGGGSSVGSPLTGATPLRFVTVDGSGNIQTSNYNVFDGDQLAFGPSAAVTTGFLGTIQQESGGNGLVIKSANVLADDATHVVRTTPSIRDLIMTMWGDNHAGTFLNGLAGASLARFYSNNAAATLYGGTDSPNYLPVNNAEYATLAGSKIKDFLTSVATGANTTETDFNSWSVPGSTLLRNGDSLVRVDRFFFAANANTKRIRVYFGATTCYDSTAMAHNGGALTLITEIIRTGAATQKAVVTAVATGTGTPIVNGVTITNPTETLSGAVTFKATMQNGTATAADITGYLTKVYAEGAGH